MHCPEDSTVSIDQGEAMIFKSQTQYEEATDDARNIIIDIFGLLPGGCGKNQMDDPGHLMLILPFVLHVKS